MHISNNPCFLSLHISRKSSGNSFSWHTKMLECIYQHYFSVFGSVFLLLYQFLLLTFLSYHLESVFLLLSLLIFCEQRNLISTCIFVFILFCVCESLQSGWRLETIGHCMKDRYIKIQEKVAQSYNQSSALLSTRWQKLLNSSVC